MQIFDTLAAFLSVLCFSVFFVLKCKVPSGFAPLSVLCIGALWVPVFGVFGALFAGGLTWYILAAVALIFTLVYQKENNHYKKLLTPAFVFFVLAGVCVIVYMAVRKPLLGSWDEYSLWASSVKLMKTSGGLYTTATTGWAWPATQSPTLPAISYLFQTFGSYAAWKIYTAYAVLYLAVIATLIGNLSFKQYKIAVPLAFIGLLTPWFFTVYTREYETRVVWLSSYGDLPAGMLFGGALMLYLGLRRAKAPLWPAMLSLSALALVKDNTFPIALVAAGIMACDLVFLGEKPTIAVLPFFTRLKRRFAKRKPPRRWPQPGQYPLSGRLVRAAGFFAAALIPYVLWGRHITSVVLQRIAAGLPVQPSESPVSAALACIGMLVGAQPKTEQFTLAANNMLAGLVGGKTTMIGNTAVIIALISALFIGTILLTSHKSLRRRAFLCMALSAAGFAAYFFELIVSFGRIFPPALAKSIYGFNRYTNSYLIGWFLFAVCFFAMAARDGKLYGAAPGIILALAGGMIFSTTRLLPLQNSDIAYPDTFYKNERAEEAKAQSVLAAAGGSGRIFFVSQGDDFGEGWLHYHYHMFPMILDYSGISEEYGGVGGGGGTFGLPGHDDGIMHYHPYTPQEFRQYLSDSGCEYLFIETLDERFIDAYGSLFSDELREGIAGNTLLYRIEGQADNLKLSPVAMEVPQ